MTYKTPPLRGQSAPRVWHRASGTARRGVFVKRARKRRPCLGAAGVRLARAPRAPSGRVRVPYGVC
eukprot:1026917-Lingulodinium_polyedra.AAC.1